MDYLDYKTGAQPDHTHSNWSFDVEEFLEKSQQREKQRIEDELDRIEQQLENRDEIHEQAINELESKLDWYLDRLENLYRWGTGTTGERKEVKSRIKEFYQEIREEKQRHWKDKQNLEQERRDLERTMEELNSSEVQRLLQKLSNI